MLSEAHAILFAWAMTLSPYQVDVQPVVEIVPQKWLEEVACEEQKCGIAGLYMDAGVVYISEDLPPQTFREVLVHEFVHYLQDVGGMYQKHPEWKDMTECQVNLQREIEAYRVSSQWSTQIQGNLPSPFVLMVYCDGEMGIGLHQ